MPAPAPSDRPRLAWSSFALSFGVHAVALVAGLTFTIAMRGDGGEPGMAVEILMEKVAEPKAELPPNEIAAEPQPAQKPEPPPPSSEPERPHPVQPRPLHSSLRTSPKAVPSLAVPSASVPVPPFPLQGTEPAEGAAVAVASSPVGQSGQGTDQDTLRAYAAELWAIIARHKPANIRRSGSAAVIFTVGADGNPGAIRIATSSGDDGLDEVAFAAIRAAAPFPPPPAGATEAQLTFKVPFHFR
jgi:periplasmic protein TonB